VKIYRQLVGDAGKPQFYGTLPYTFLVLLYTSSCLDIPRWLAISQKARIYLGHPPTSRLRLSRFYLG
jgi:hypothetical protein